jgi:dienelactone hydrolase
MHMMAAGEWALPPNEDLAAARELDETLKTAELFLYSGDQHLFAERGRPGYDERAATLLEQRVLGFLDTIG